jgi:TonB family protein
MRPQALFLPFLLLGAVIAQDTIPIPLTGRDAAPVCHGKVKYVAGCITPPRVTYQASPELPKDLKARKNGTVVLSLVVGADGQPREVKVDRSLSSELDEEAIKAVTKWRFDAATQNGKLVAVRTDVEVTFHY